MENVSVNNGIINNIKKIINEIINNDDIGFSKKIALIEKRINLLIQAINPIYINKELLAEILELKLEYREMYYNCLKKRTKRIISEFENTVSITRDLLEENKTIIDELHQTVLLSKKKNNK